MKDRSPRLAKTLPAQILAALDTQTVIVPGTVEFGRVIAGVAAQLAAVRTERAHLTDDLEKRLKAHPLAEVLTPMPGVGIRTAITWLIIVGDTSAFLSAAHLASYAGPAPVTRKSGSSIRGESRSQRGNHALKSALFLSAFVSLSDPAGRTYYNRKLAAGKHHNAAPICLAALFAMLRTGSTYQPLHTYRHHRTTSGGLTAAIATPPPGRAQRLSCSTRPYRRLRDVQHRLPGPWPTQRG
jgi:transposase